MELNARFCLGQKVKIDDTIYGIVSGICFRWDAFSPEYEVEWIDGGDIRCRTFEEWRLSGAER